MTVSAPSTSKFLSGIHYSDVEGSARWLCHAFGFQVHSAVRNVEGVMDYVHLTFGNATVIVRAIDGADASAVRPRGSDSLYLFVTDVARHYADAKSAGASIVIELQTLQGKGQSYSCRDPEGHVWSFGAFDPCKAVTDTAFITPDEATHPQTVVEPDFGSEHAEPIASPADAESLVHDAMPATTIAMPQPFIPGQRQASRSHALAVSALVGGLLGAIAVGALLYATSAPSIEAQIANEQQLRAQSEQAADRAKQALAGERAAKESFQRAARLIQGELANLQSERSQLVRQVEEARQLQGSTAQVLQEAEADKAALEGRISDSEQQRVRAEQQLAEEIEKARAAARQAQLEKSAMDVAMNQRVFTFEAALRDAESKTREAEAARSAAQFELAKAREERRKADVSLADVVKQLDFERQARVAAEREASSLRTKLAARQPASRVAKQQAVAPSAKQRTRKAISAKVARGPAASSAAKRPRPVAAKSMIVDDVWFAP